MRAGSVYMDHTRSSTVLGSSESKMTLPMDLLALAWPSVPTSMGPMGASGTGKTGP